MCLCVYACEVRKVSCVCARVCVCVCKGKGEVKVVSGIVAVYVCVHNTTKLQIISPPLALPTLHSYHSDSLPETHILTHTLYLCRMSVSMILMCVCVSVCVCVCV